MKYYYLSLQVILVLLFSLIHSIYAKTYLSEINFIDEEYVEIYSNDSINFSNFKIYDDLGPSKFNSISQIQNKFSNISLIVGSNFLNRYNLSNLNCNLYKTSGTQLSNGGLKSNGEDFLLTNQSINFSWKKDKDYNFEKNQSLHFNLNYSKILNNSPCVITKFENKFDLNLTQNQTNLTNQTQINSCNYNFKIELKPRKFDEKLEFSFNTNATNYSINYWVENYHGDILKDKIETQNKNSKSYSPKQTSPIYIKSNLNEGNCSFYDEIETFYFNKDDFKEEKKEIIQKEESPKTNSYIEIIDTQIDDGILNLNLEIYRGDSSKRLISIYNNGKRLHSFEILNKYSKLKLKLLVNLNLGENDILVKGFDLEKDFSVNNSFEEEKINLLEEITNLEETNLKINFFNLSQLNQTITKALFLPQEKEIQCYILNKKTKVSNEFNKILSPGFYIIENKINLSQIKNSTNLKHICKYKTPGSKSYNYETEEFFYNISNIELFSELNQDYFNSEIEFKNKTFNIEKKLENISYESSNTKLKQNSKYPVLGVMSTLMIIMLALW